MTDTYNAASNLPRWTRRPDGPRLTVNRVLWRYTRQPSDPNPFPRVRLFSWLRG